MKGVCLKEQLKKHESVVGVWIAGFDRSEVVLAKGRRSWPLSDPEGLRAALAQYGPESIMEIEPGNIAYNTTLHKVSVHGYAASMRNSGGETQSLGSLRWQMQGSRRSRTAYCGGGGPAQGRRFSRD